MRTLRWMALALSIGLVVAACGDDDDDSTAATSATTSAAATDTTTAGSATTAAAATTTPASVATGGAKTVLGSGIPSGDACPKKALTGVPGVTDTEISIGGVVAVTNPQGSKYDEVVKGLLAYIKGVNDAGGVCGRQLKYVKTIDDQASLSRDLLGARTLIEEDKVFAIAPIVTSNFGAAEYIAGTDVPTFGWNINAEWSKGDNMFGEKGSFICQGGVNAPECNNQDVVYLAAQLVKAKKVAILTYGSAPSSVTCGNDQAHAFERWGAANGVSVAFQDNSLEFGFQPEALGPTIDKIRSDNVDMLFTCMDEQANYRIINELQNAGLKTAMYWPNGYNRPLLQEFGDQVKNFVVTGSFFRPFEAPPSPGMKSYLATMEATNLPVGEFTLTGWINADLLVTGIRAAGGTDGTFDQKKVVDSINSLRYNAGGILPEFLWKDFHFGPTGPIDCYAYEIVDGASKSFKLVAPDPAKPWTCFDNGDPSKFHYETFGETDTGLSTTAVQGTATVSGAGGAAAQPDDPAKATADIVALVDAYVSAPSAEARLATIANGDSIATYVTQAFSGVAVKALDTKVTFTGKNTADVAFGIELGGTKLEGITSTGYVINVGGKWLWHPLAACDSVSQTKAELGPKCIQDAKVP